MTEEQTAIEICRKKAEKISKWRKDKLQKLLLFFSFEIGKLQNRELARKLGNLIVKVSEPVPNAMTIYLDKTNEFFSSQIITEVIYESLNEELNSLTGFNKG